MQPLINWLDDNQVYAPTPMVFVSFFSFSFVVATHIATHIVGPSNVDVSVLRALVMVPEETTPINEDQEQPHVESGKIVQENLKRS
jgi:hypothetical protein